MASKASSNQPKKGSASAPEDVEAFLASLDHPSKPEILAIREIILGADPSIAEGIKWNAPSFYTTEHFATMNLRAKDGMQVILHFGAKKRDRSSPSAAIADPESLIEWLAEDRALAKFRNLEEVHARRSGFVDVIRQWIQHV